MAIRPTSPAGPAAGEHAIDLHGHEVGYLRLGEGPPLVLLHGITASARSWDGVLPGLAAHHTVIAPDLLGHGRSAKPQGDYSLGAHAAGVRDLLVALGFERATVVGHSLGGGVAMQLAYQFPERVDRLVLVSSGGLGRDLHGLLRAATLPGADWVLPALCHPRLVGAVGAAGRLAARAGLRASTDVRGVAEGLASLAEPGAARAFLHTVRGIADPGGQRIDASDRLYLAAELPTLVVWGEDDPIIPVAHAHAAHALMPHSRLEVFPGAGHFPFRDAPDRFVAVVNDFVASTEPSTADARRFRELLTRRAQAA